MSVHQYQFVTVLNLLTHKKYQIKMSLEIGTNVFYMLAMIFINAFGLLLTLSFSVFIFIEIRKFEICVYCSNMIWINDLDCLWLYHDHCYFHWLKGGFFSAWFMFLLILSKVNSIVVDLIGIRFRLISILGFPLAMWIPNLIVDRDYM